MERIGRAFLLDPTKGTSQYQSRFFAAHGPQVMPLPRLDLPLHAHLGHKKMGWATWLRCLGRGMCIETA